VFLRLKYFSSSLGEPATQGKEKKKSIKIKICSSKLVTGTVPFLNNPGQELGHGIQNRIKINPESVLTLVQKRNSAGSNHVNEKGIWTSRVPWQQCLR